MSKYHISKDGVARACRAKSSESCTATSSDQKEHYETREEAQKAYENLQNKSSAAITKLNKNNKNIKSVHGVDFDEKIWLITGSSEFSITAGIYHYSIKPLIYEKNKYGLVEKNYVSPEEINKKTLWKIESQVSEPGGGWAGTSTSILTENGWDESASKPMQLEQAKDKVIKLAKYNHMKKTNKKDITDEDFNKYLKGQKTRYDRLDREREEKYDRLERERKERAKKIREEI